MKFSKEQLEAINHINGPALVLAVPGSGKTTVLLARINNLIKNGVNPKKILAMTFSKSQALDMEARYKNLYSDNSVQFSTIHSFAYGLIRSFYNKNIELIESNPKYNKYHIVSHIYSKIKHRKINDEQLEDFFRVAGFLKNTLMDYKEYRKMYSPIFSGFEQVFSEYEKYKKERNLIDFDDMLLLSLQILQNNENTLKFIQERFDYIQIDEGQDTSFVQLKIISLIAKPTDNLFIVADDDQSIYGFRGASSKQLLNFPQNYQKAKIYYMKNNYRSTSSITNISNKLIKNNKNRYKKFINSTKEDGNIININRVKNTESQAKHVLKRALKDIDNGKTVAILYRNNISAINIINFIDENIDFFIKDGKYAFYSHPIIQDIKNIINFSIDNYDIKSFEKVYYKFNLFIKKDFIEQVKMMNENLDVIEKLKEVEGMNPFFLDKIYLLAYHVRKLGNLDFCEQIKYILFNMEYYEYLKEFSRRSSTSMINIDRNIDTLLNISKNIKTLSDFENKINYLIDKQKKHSKSNSNLVLSTIHGSKGLEFDSVYMIDLIDKEFPSLYSISVDDELGVLEEERRLFYVGMTRAKHDLSLFFPSRLYENDTNQSQFIDEIYKD